MTDLEQEAAWRNEFEADGERAVLDTICHGPGIYPDPKRLFALRWLRERAVERARQEQKMRSCVVQPRPGTENSASQTSFPRLPAKARRPIRIDPADH